jgi:hypothetical protein
VGDGHPLAGGRRHDPRGRARGARGPGFWAQYGPGATGVGWELGLVGLGLHLETGAPVDPEEALSWPTTPEGIAFVRHAAAGWAAAAVADGDDAAAARDAAENTVGFYTVRPRRELDGLRRAG